MPRRPTIAAFALGVACLVLLGAEPAQAKEFTLPRALVEVRVDPTGALHITEHITYSFDGPFSGAYREIPLRDGESISNVSVREGDAEYTPGASTELGSFGLPGTFGVAKVEGNRTRIVWHYSAVNESRTFEVSYTFVGLSVAYDDVVDVNLRVWGDEWAAELSRLEARIQLPGRAPGDVYVWGHPASVDGVTELDSRGRGASLRAANVPPEHWVEMRVVFPRSLLQTTSGAREEQGDGLQEILDEEAEFAANAERDRARVQWFKENAGWLLPLGLLLTVAPAGGICSFIWWRFGREPRVPPGPRHVFEPPGDEAPAMVAALLEPTGDRATGNAFAATLFDLIRRGDIEAMPITTIKKTWGGLREEDLSDLSIKIAVEGKAKGLEPFEIEVLETVRMAAKEGALPLSRLRDEIKKEGARYQKRFQRFTGDVLAAVKKRGWWQAGGFKPAAIACVVS